MKTPTVQLRRAHRGALSFAAVLLTLLSAACPAHSETVPPQSIRAERELFITAPAVMDSDAAFYPGAWSFGTLVTELVGEEKAGECVAEWLSTWCAPQTVNGQVVMPRSRIEELVIAPWRDRDGYDAKSGQPWKPNLAHAPFRLLAIVNRMDLCAPDVAGTFAQTATAWSNAGRGVEFAKLTQPEGLQTSAFAGYGGAFTSGQSFGEGRLVFGAMDAQGQPLAGDWTVIFEYRLQRATDRGLHEWAMSWHALSVVDVNDAQFPPLLEQVTRQFTHNANKNCATVALAQLRSSEAAFGADREFRQFQLVSGRLQLAPLTQTPAAVFAKPHGREHDLLAEFLHARDPLIRSGVHSLPASLAGRRGSAPLLAGSAFIPATQPDFHWEIGNAVSPAARRLYSLNTCNGCHAGETGCRDGLHVHSRATGSASRLSEFLRTDGQPLRVADPARHAEKVEYREMADRAAIFAALLENKERDRLADLRDVLRGRLQRAH